MEEKRQTKEEVAKALIGAIAGLQQWVSRPEIRSLLKGGGKIDLASPRGWILARLINEGPARITELATWLDVDKSTVTPQAAALEELGYVSRRPDASDRRAHQLVVTTAGKRAFAQSISKAQAVFSELLGSWTDDELDTFSYFIGKLNSELDQWGSQ